MDFVPIRLPSGDVIRAEVVNTPQAQQTGLLKYSSLPKDGAMLFPYRQPTDVQFHTIGMKFPIEIILLEKVEE